MRGVRPRPGRSRAAVLRVRRSSRLCLCRLLAPVFVVSNSIFKFVIVLCRRSNPSEAGTRSVGSRQGRSGREDLIVDFVLYGAGRRIERGELVLGKISGSMTHARVHLLDEALFGRAVNAIEISCFRCVSAFLLFAGAGPLGMMLLLCFHLTYVGWSRPIDRGAPDVRRMRRADGVDMAHGDSTRTCDTSA